MDKTVGSVLDRAGDQWPDTPAMRVKRGGRWQTTTWAQYRQQARDAAKGFIALGLQPGHGVTILGYNRPEWFLADIGAILAGGVPAGIYTTSSPEQCRYITAHCDADVAVVENRVQLDKLLAVRDSLPALRAIVVMDGAPGDHPNVMGWDELMALGRAQSDEPLQHRLDAQQPSGLCTLIYTSGTTGPPKAVMITHRNLTWTAHTVTAMIGGFGPGDDLISYLPLSHIAEQLVSLHMPMTFGGCSWFAESIETLGDTLREVRPVAFLGVPRVWEKIQARIIVAAAQNGPVARRIGAWARGVGLRAGLADQAGRQRPLLYPLANKLVFSKVRQRLGLDRCRIAITSTAPTPRATLEFFLSLGIPLLEVYGMSEATGPATISLPSRYRTSTAGFALDGCELKILDDGEVCMRGPNIFAGYLKDPQATREALDDDGWLHSGDIGHIDADGFLTITDRKKELIITAGGKNISPQAIEAQLKTVPGIVQAAAVGDGRRFVSALIVIDPEQVPSMAASAGSTARTVAEAASDPAFLAFLQAQIDRACAHLSRVEAVKKFAIVDGEFSVEGGELTPTMKLKRRVIATKYKHLIDAMYDEAGTPAGPDRRRNPVDARA
jgi:long-subunit acyl-CoA synthetase (AMP-forming)